MLKAFRVVLQDEILFNQSLGAVGKFIQEIFSVKAFRTDPHNLAFKIVLKKDIRCRFQKEMQAGPFLIQLDLQPLLCRNVINNTPAKAFFQRVSLDLEVFVHLRNITFKTMASTVKSRIIIISKPAFVPVFEFLIKLFPDQLPVSNSL